MRHMHGRFLILQFNMINESFGSCTSNLNYTLLGQLLDGLAASDQLNQCGEHIIFSPVWERGASMHITVSHISRFHNSARETPCLFYTLFCL